MTILTKPYLAHNIELGLQMKRVFKLLKSVVSCLSLKALHRRASWGQLSVVSCQLLVIIIFLASLITLTLTVASPVHAQCTSDPKATDQEIINQFNKCAISENIYDDKIFNFNQISGTVDSLNTLLLGTSALHPQTNALTINHSALAKTSNLVASLYANPPASGVQYFAREIRKFNPVQPAYAQTTGVGYDALQPVQKLWSVFRNASYVGFVIVFVIMGFMIMFRAHISPQAVATVQDSIPRIIIALFLVTFSYAIAGLMIDIMFLAINIVINLLASTNPAVISAPDASSVIFDRSIIGVITNGWTDIFGTTANAIHNLLESIGLSGGLTSILTWGVGGIAALIVGIAAIFIMFRIFLMLLMAYVTIIILTMIAPFFFLIQALPGNNGAKEWFKQMGANISVFPTVALMIIFAGVIGGIKAFGGTGAGQLTEEVGAQAVKFPLLVGGLDPDSIGKIIGIGFLLATPEVVTLVKGFLGAKGPGIGMPAALAGAAGAVGAAGRYGAKEALGSSNLPFVGGSWQRQREAKRQDTAQIRAEAGIYNPEYGKLIKRAGEEKTPSDKN